MPRVKNAHLLALTLLLSSFFLACAEQSTQEDPQLALPKSNSPRAFARAQITLERCEEQGGSVVGDIGDGRIHRADYRCMDGSEPIGSIVYVGDSSRPVEGSVCCP